MSVSLLLRVRPTALQRVVRVRWSSAAASSPAGELVTLPADNPLLPATPMLEVRRMPGRGRCLIAAAPIPAGRMALHAQPLAAVADPEKPHKCCQYCFRRVPAIGGVPQGVSCSACGTLYCSEACRVAARKHGHDALCGATAELDAFCRQKRHNFPRVAAQMLARGFSESTDFVRFWEAVNFLTTMSVPADAALLPPVWSDGYALVRKALSTHMTGGADYFFDSVFDLRTYARLMGTLRLNSFALKCPVDADAEAGNAGSSGAAAAAAAADGAPTAGRSGSTAGGLLGVATAAAEAVDPALAAGLTAAAAGSSCSTGGSCSTSGSGESSSAGADGGAGAPASDGGCGGGGDCGSNSSLPSAIVEARGGTAVYGLPSMINHDCDPNLDVVMGPKAELWLVARRPIAAGEELSITYMDSSRPFAERRARLLHGYGFECACAKCQRDKAEHLAKV